MARPKRTRDSRRTRGYLGAFVLDMEGNPLPCEDVEVWCAWYEQVENRRVAETRLSRAYVSTVFLGLDHNWGDGPPVLWETMAFRVTYGPGRKKKLDLGGLWAKRATSREEALAHHAEAVTWVKAQGLDED